MANRKTTMVDLRLMLRKLKQGISEKALSKEMGLARTSIRVYKERLANAGVDYDTALKMDDAQLSAVLTKPAKGRPQDARMAELEPLLKGYAEDHKLPHRGYDIIYGEYITAHPNGYCYNRFREILSDWEKNHNYTFINVHRPGEKMQIDFAGDAMWLWDKDTDKPKQKLYILCCLLPCSSLSFVYALPHASMEWMFYGLSQCLSYFGGVPLIALSDNMKQWVKEPERYEPDFNEAAKQWALHYGCSLEATRVAKPRDKGAVESLVYQAYRYIYGRMAKEKYYDINSLNARIAELLDEFNSRPMSGRNYSRFDQFEAEEKAALLPLPEDPYMFKYSKKFKLGPSYHVEIYPERCRYSAPFTYVGKECVAIYDNERVDIYCNYQLIATHKRRTDKGPSTERSHMPPNHKFWAKSKEFNAETFRYWASLIGPHTERVMLQILHSKEFPVQSYSSCHGLLYLGKKYGEDRLEAACRRTEGLPAVHYGMIMNILEKNLDKEPLQANSNKPYIPLSENIRGAEEYA